MTNRQSNIIFYSVISIIIYALVINHFKPELLENFSKSNEERSIQEAMNKGEHNLALTIYQQMIENRITEDDEFTAETATIYEEMAELYSLLSNKAEAKNYYLKSLNIKKQLKRTNRFNFANTYEKLGSLTEEEGEYEEAQQYYENSLSKRLGVQEEDDEGLFMGMMNSRQRYLRLNNEVTIETFKKLAEIHILKKEHTTAKQYYEKAIAASKLTFGEGDIKTLELIELMNQIVL